MAIAKIRFEVVMEYETGLDPYASDIETAAQAKRFLENHHCHANIAEALAGLAASDDAHRVCNICRFSKVTLLSRGAEAYSGYRKASDV